MSLTPEQYAALSTCDRARLLEKLERRLSEHKTEPGAIASQPPEDPPAGSAIASDNPDRGPPNLRTFGAGENRGRPRKGPKPGPRLKSPLPRTHVRVEEQALRGLERSRCGGGYRVGWRRADY